MRFRSSSRMAMAQSSIVHIVYARTVVRGGMLCFWAQDSIRAGSWSYRLRVGRMLTRVDSPASHRSVCPNACELCQPHAQCTSIMHAWSQHPDQRIVMYMR